MSEIKQSNKVDNRKNVAGPVEIVVKNVNTLLSLLPKRKKKVTKNYKQFYRKVWEDIPEFKDWLSEIPGERTLAFCKICQKTLHAHRLSLTKHTVSLRHSRLAQKKASEKTAEEETFYQEECWAQESDEERVEGSGVMEIEGDEGLGRLEESEEVATERVIAVEEVATSICDDEQLPNQEQQIFNSNITPSATVPITLRKVSEKTLISTHVLDTSRGVPAAGLAVSLYQLVQGRWTMLREGQTNGDGRCVVLSGSGGKAGRFKLHYDTDRYFDLFKLPTLYPFVEIVFDVCSPEEKYHIPLLLSPYGYSTYKGS